MRHKEGGVDWGKQSGGAVHAANKPVTTGAADATKQQ